MAAGISVPPGDEGSAGRAFSGVITSYSIHYTKLYESWQAIQALGVADFLNAAVRDGRIVNPGFSFHGLAEDFTPIVDAYPWVFCQIQYNFLDTDFQAGTKGLKYAASKDMGVIIMEPLRGGNLALPTPPPAIADIWDLAEVKLV